MLPDSDSPTGPCPPTGEDVPPLPTTDYDPEVAPERVIAGRYTLLEKIGEGGMGEVWVARQTEPVKRKVAVKLIKAGMDSRAVVQRFEQERQALAMMDHHSIAKVLDGGLTEHRRPFFVMELVGGQPLTRYCDDAKLGIRERLNLFIPICQAVQHAHQKGIVHRDLKPSNILVVTVDGKPVPKVIDFGVAKATGGKLTDESIATQLGAVIGTLGYMAPEQAGGTGGGDIDTRADVYALGVILYELLTGLRPIDAERLHKAALAEVIRIIQDEEPSRPSTRLGTNASLPSLAAVRQIDPRKLVTLLRGELDWVVMKCLEKSRDRRYETANALGRDIQRYLANEPVEARPPSAGYRLRKFLARNKRPVLAVALVLLALVGGIAGTTWGLIAARQQERQTELERDKAARNADAAIEVVRDLSAYVEAYELSAGNNAGSLTQRLERLNSALASYQRLLELHPEDTQVRWHVARLYRLHANLSRFLDKTAEAEKSYQAAIQLFKGLADDHPDKSDYRELSALTLRDFGGFVQRLGRNQEAARLFDDTIELYEELHRTHPEDANYQRNLAHAILSRADQRMQVGRFAESEQANRRSADLHARLAEMPSTRIDPLDPLFHAMADHNLAMALREQARYKEALAGHDRAVERMAAMIKVSNSRDALSFYHRTRTERAWTQGQEPATTPAAIADLESAMLGWDKLNKQLGQNPVDLQRTGVAGYYCGRLKARSGQHEAAARDLAAAAKIQEGLVAKQPQIPLYRYDLGRTYMAMGQPPANPQQAAGYYRQAREMLDAALERYPENALYRQALTELDVATRRK